VANVAKPYGAKPEKPGYRRSAALALYEDVYGGRISASCNSNRDPTSDHVGTRGEGSTEAPTKNKVAQPSGPTMDVFWAHRDAQPKTGFSCLRGGKNNPTIREIKNNLFPGIPEWAVPVKARTCPPFRTIFAWDLLRSETDEPEIAVKDKIVMIGGKFSFTADFIDPPGHAKLPGVYLHAMALDNLLIYGNSYRRPITKDDPWQIRIPPIL